MTRARAVGRWVLGTAVTLLGLGGLRWATAVPLAYRPAGALLRLSWSARPERIETCRTLSAKELAEREEHMRQRVECTGSFASYALAVAVDGKTVADLVVRGGGFRHDRPLYLLREVPLAGGRHHLRVTFTRRERTDDDAAAFAPVATPDADTGLFAGRARREAAEHARRAEAAIPPRLVLDTSVTLSARSVALVTLPAGRRALVLRTASPPQ